MTGFRRFAVFGGNRIRGVVTSVTDKRHPQHGVFDLCGVILAKILSPSVVSHCLNPLPSDSLALLSVLGEDFMRSRSILRRLLAEIEDGVAKLAPFQSGGDPVFD
jgi:hypothetical protein